MIDLVRQAPAWIIDNPWTAAGALVGLMLLSVGALLLNPEGRQVRELLRRKK